MNLTPHKLFTFNSTDSSINFQVSEIEVKFPSPHIHILPLVIYLLLISSKFTKIFKLNPTVILLQFKTLLISHLLFRQDTWAIMNLLPPKINNYPIRLMMLTFFDAMFRSYYPDLSEPKPPVCRTSIQQTNVEVINLQPSQFLNRPVHSLPYSPDTQQFLNKFNFRYSDVTDDECLKLRSIRVKNQRCYATHCNDVGKIATPFRIRPKPNAKE